MQANHAVVVWQDKFLEQIDLLVVTCKQAPCVVSGQYVYLFICSAEEMLLSALK
jgi:hypothetical protein